MSGQIKINTILTGSNKTVVVDDLQTASEVQTAIKTRSGDAGAFSFRNKIIDGRFDFWYEGTSQTSNGFGSATMFNCGHAGATKTASQQLLTASDLPAIDVPTAKYYLRHVVTSVVGSSNFCKFKMPIEGVRTLAGKQIAFSFYARTDSVGKKVAIEFYQAFGTSGSTGVTTYTEVVPVTTDWSRYVVTTTLPNLAGKTIGTSNDCLVVVIWFDAGSTMVASALGHQSGTFDIACVQLEEGTVATPFEELPIEISKNRVSRYFVYHSAAGTVNIASGWTSSSAATLTYPLPTAMRSSPVLVYKALSYVVITDGISSYTATSLSVAIDDVEHQVLSISAPATLTAGRPCVLRLAAGGYIAFDSRL